MGRASLDLSVRLLLARTAAEVQRFGDGDARVLWLGTGTVPDTLASRAIPLDEDPELLEGWLAIRRLGDEVVGGRSVKQALGFDEVSLWWFVHYWLVYGDGLAGWDEIYRVLKRVLAGVATAPQEMVLLTGRADDDMVARAVSRAHRVPYRWAASPWTRFTQRLGLRWRAEALIRLRMAKLLLRGFLARRLDKNSLARRGPVDLVFNTSSGSWDAARSKERLLSPVLDEAARRGLSVAGLHLDYRRNLGVDSLRLLDRKIVAWESLVTPALAMRALARGRVVARGLGGGFPGHVLGIPAADLLADRLPVLFGARLADAVLAIETARTALGTLRPRCLYVVDAYDLWGRALVVAAREAHIPAIEVQHGIILANHGGYLHLEGEVAPDLRQTSPYSPLPDIIVVHGDAAKAALMETGHFPPETIQITGSPSIEAARGRQAERSQIRSKLGLKDDHVVALFFGAPRHVFPADDLHVRAFLACCSGIQGLAPLLRPHPIDHSNPERYRAAARDAGVDAPVLLGGDPLELVLAADIVVSHNSTTALDTMALDRAVIHINMSGSPDLFPFVVEGRALGAHTEDELQEALSSLLAPGARAAQAANQHAYAVQSYAPCANPAEAILRAGFPEVIRA
jgi:hypothetical protein